MMLQLLCMNPASENVDFDLPDIETAPPAAPRVQIVGEVCVSCEG